MRLADTQSQLREQNPHLAASSCLSASPTTAATLASVPNTVLKEVVDGRTGELQHTAETRNPTTAQHGTA
jgi:hypothetical protein